MTQDLTELVQISDMLKERALAEHRKNVQESQRIAQEIEQIDTLRQQALRDENSLMARRSVGADALWDSWLMRRRAELMREAAIARAYETESLTRARAAFAKSEASQSVLKDEILARRKDKLRKAADVLDDLSVLRRGFAAD